MSQRGGASQSGSGSGGESRRDLARRTEEAIQELARLNLEEGEPIMDPKKPPGQSGNRVKLDTNVYGMRTGTAHVYRYDITISGVLQSRGRDPRVVEFTKRTREDSVVVDRKDKCRAVFAAFARIRSDVVGDNPSALYYDLQSVLYTLQPLVLQNGQDQTFEIPADLFNEEEWAKIDIASLHHVEMLVKQVQSHFEIALDDFSAISQNVSQIDHSLQTFLELATSQYALFTPTEHVSYGGGQNFLMNPLEHGFNQDDSPSLKNGQYLAIGAQKSCKFLEGPRGRDGQGVGLIIQTKKAPFHVADQRVIDKAAEILVDRQALEDPTRLQRRDLMALKKQLQGLHCDVRLPSNRVKEIRIQGVVEENANSMHVNVTNMGDVTIAQYYTNRYSNDQEGPYRLGFPNAPLLTVSERQRTVYFPMELCFVKDNQRVTIAQQERRDIATMIRKCAIPPAQLKHQNHLNARALHLGDSNWLQSANINVVERPLKVSARHLPPPGIQYGAGAQSELPDPMQARWKQTNKRYLVPAACKIWASCMVTVEENRRDRFTWDQYMEFIKIFHTQCNQKGMDMAVPTDYRRIRGNDEELENMFQLCKDNNVEFMLFVTDDAIKNLHNSMKRLELKYGIVTQDINSSNAYEVITKRKVQTMENIINKTNIKLGGINYSLVVNDQALRQIFPETLFIGLGMSHPAAQTGYERARETLPAVPSVTGYAANFKKDFFDFVGDYVFDEPRRDEKFTVVHTIVENCARRYIQNRGQPPRRLVIFRNGTSEGQFASILRFEVPFIRQALNDSNAPDCKLTLLVPQKMHNIRMFPEVATPGASEAMNNVKPGTVVDTGIVHPRYNEFYLNSHQAIQGSAKTPRYTVLVDESDFTMDIMEAITYDLSFSHQIVTLATSLPSPAYIALEYAKRGRNNFSVFRREEHNDPELRLPDGTLNYERLSNTLSYSQIPTLRDKRVNA